MFYWLSIPIGIILTLLVFRVAVRRDYRVKGSLTFFSTFLEFLVFGTHANLPYLYLETPWPQLPPLPSSNIQTYAGLVVLLLGLLATLGIMAILGFRPTLGEQPHQLCRSGPYAWSRNPQLLTYLALLLGFAILYPSWQAAAWIVLYGVIAHTMVLTEEEHLGNIFQDEYQDYRRQVPRYIRIFPYQGKTPTGPRE